MWLILAYLGILVGTGLVAVGRRGKRVDHHRLCRRCRYDLWGSIGSSNCPECGANLCVPGVRRPRGNRVRRPGMILAGVLLVVPCLALGGAGTYAEASGWNYRQHLPLSLLIYQAQSDSPALRSQSFAELNRRLKHDPACRMELIDKALEVQGTVSIPWDQAWGDIVERAYDDGLLTDAQWDRYVRQAIPIEVRLEPSAGGGKAVAVASICSRTRSASRLFHCMFNLYLQVNEKEYCVVTDGWLDTRYMCWRDNDNWVFPRDALKDLPAGPNSVTVEITGYIIAKGTTVEVSLKQTVPVYVRAEPVQIASLP